MKTKIFTVHAWENGAHFDAYFPPAYVLPVRAINETEAEKRAKNKLAKEKHHCEVVNVIVFL